MRKNTLQFIFTSSGVVAECHAQQATGSDRFWTERFEKDNYTSIYEYGLDAVEAESISALFVKKLVKTFLKKLTQLPELEILRENSVVTFTKQEKEQLLEAVPFALGTEYVTEAWLERVLKELNQVFQREMAVYEGTVALYLEEKIKNCMCRNAFSFIW